MKRWFLITLCVMVFASCENAEMELQDDLIENHKNNGQVGSLKSASLSTIESLQTSLNVLYNVNVGGVDFMATKDAAEAANFTIDGQTYYLPSTAISGKTAPFYRLYNGSEHMTSFSASGEGNYSVEGGLGHAWKGNTAPDGTVEMFRGYNSSIGDHALMNPNYLITGYSQELFSNKYTYPRYDKSEQLLWLQGNAIKVVSNLVTGGTVWELWWNGKQFLDHLDYGREMQASLNLGNDALPTEGGDKWTNSNTFFMHGSPVVEAYNSGTTQVTKAVPLEWNNELFNASGSQHEVVIYKDFKLGKNLKLDQSLNLGSYSYLNNQIITYETTFYTPIELPGVHIEIPTAYLPLEFNRFFEIDATQSDLNVGLTEVSLNVGESQQAPIESAGGIVIANSNLNYAMGVYINIDLAKSLDSDSNAVYYFRNWSFGNTSKWSSARYGTIAAGNNTYTTYVIVGTLDDVRVAMRCLYLNNY